MSSNLAWTYSVLSVSCLSLYHSSIDTSTPAEFWLVVSTHGCPGVTLSLQGSCASAQTLLLCRRGFGSVHHKLQETLPAPRTPGRAGPENWISAPDPKGRSPRHTSGLGVREKVGLSGKVSGCCGFSNC